MATAPRNVPAFAVGRTNPPTLAGVAAADTVDRVTLANEVRRGILAALHDHGGSLSSHDIARRFEIPWQVISRHLRILTEAGLPTAMRARTNAPTASTRAGSGACRAAG